MPWIRGKGKKGVQDDSLGETSLQVQTLLDPEYNRGPSKQRPRRGKRPTRKRAVTMQYGQGCPGWVRRRAPSLMWGHGVRKGFQEEVTTTYKANRS